MFPDLLAAAGASEHKEVRQALLDALLAWRADLCDIEALRTRTGRGGPVAQRAAALSDTKRGTDAENRLGARIPAVDTAPA